MLGALPSVDMLGLLLTWAHLLALLIAGGCCFCLQ
jgi:hypothetical protein